jgi:hypothetical protein
MEGSGIWLFAPTKAPKHALEGQGDFVSATTIQNKNCVTIERPQSLLCIPANRALVPQYTSIERCRSIIESSQVCEYILSNGFEEGMK